MLFPLYILLSYETMIRHCVRFGGNKRNRTLVFK